MSNEKLYINGNLCSVITFAVVVRLSVSLHPYSGQNVPPMFGDYEAQRHWMEITVNLPPEEWYMNTTNNDLMYWGLDYPPVTAYHSYINGKIAQYLEPDFVKIYASRGYESISHKFFMRTTVIVTDLLVYFLSVIIFFSSIYRVSQKCVDAKHGEVDESNKSNNQPKICNISVSYLAQIAITLLYPGLILIDHGHFQYNSISLGFTINAITALVYERFCLSSFFFCLALNYKQMSLYHSLPFFVYMLSHCLEFKSRNLFGGLKRLLSISFTVIVTFVIIWFPFLRSKDIFLQVVSRLFPLSRGIFEDKVSNVWCAVNIFIKLSKTFSQVEMAKICVICVLIASLPSLISLFKHPTIKKLLLSLINVSLSFFLFSYQVHEKSILLVALPVILYFPYNPFPCFWFLVISNFSMLPLFLKDNLLIPFVSLSFLFALFVYANVSFETSGDKKLSKNLCKQNIISLFNLLFKLSLFGCVTIFVCSICIKPPDRYPDIWPLLSSVYSCFHFGLFLLYFNYVQIFKTVD